APTLDDKTERAAAFLHPCGEGIGAAACVARTAKLRRPSWSVLCHMIELGRLRLETDDGVAQALAEGQLRKSHAPQLVLAGEALDAVIALEAGDTAPERVHRQAIHQLREYELPFVHGRLPAAVWDGEAGGSRKPGSSR